MDCHLAQVLKILAFGFQGDSVDLTLKRFKQELVSVSNKM
jgi:hypothetical protein